MSNLAIAVNRRKHAVARYFFVLALTLGAYALYSLFVVPIVEPHPTEFSRATLIEGDYQVPIDDKSAYEHLFQPDDWELGLCKTLETRQGKILFLDYKRQGDDTWDVYPFTMILESEQTGQQNADSNETTPPFVLRSLKGARLSFDRALEFGGGKKSATLERAQLMGEVDLIKGPTAADKNDGVKIKTSNVQVTENRIFTLDDVWFEFGNNKGQGRNLSVDLAHNTPAGAISTDFSKINGIQRVQLAFLKLMRLEPSATGPSPMANDRDQLFASRKSPLEITADGAFEFDLNTSQAQFRDRVLVRSLDDSGDTLQCDLLHLTFKTDGKTKEINLSQPVQSQYVLQLIRAVGSPCRLQANSQNAYVVGEQIVYDLAESRIEVRGKQQVEIGKDDSRFFAQQIIYQLSDDRRIGPLDATGPGQMIRKQAGIDRQFYTSWEKLLTIRPDGPEKKLVTMDGKAFVRLDSQTSIQSGNMKLWLWEIPTGDPTAQVARWDYQPEKLVADSDVHINSPKLQGQAGQLVATWPANPQVPDRESPPTNQKNQSDKPLSNAPVVPPADSRNANLRRSVDLKYAVTSETIVRRVDYQQDLNPRTSPLKFQGNQVQVVLEGIQNQTQIKDLTIIGNIRVWKQPQSAGRPGIDIQGQSLRAIPQPGDLYRIQVNGTNQNLASVHSEQLDLEGKNIQMDQAANRLWVEGYGTMKLVGQGPQTANPPNGIGKSDSGRTIDLTWDGGMIFDGQKIYFEKNVTSKTVDARPDGGSTQTQTLSAALSVMLAQQVNFQDFEGGTGNSSRIDVREMIFVEQLAPENEAFKQVAHLEPVRTPVVFEHQLRDRQGIVQDLIKVIAPHATVRSADNQIVAHGPGSLVIYRRGARKKWLRTGICTKDQPTFHRAHVCAD